MHHFTSIRRLALAAALAGAAIGIVPAIASAQFPKQPTCTYNDGTRQVNVFDKSDVFPLELDLLGSEIVAGGQSSVFVRCFSTTGSGRTATVLNTDKIVVSGTLKDLQTGGQPGDPPRPIDTDGYVIDMSHGRFAPGFTKETDGNSEIEMIFETGTDKPVLEVIGTENADEVHVGGPGWLSFGYDNDTDVKARAGASRVRVKGNGGADYLTALGHQDQFILPRASVPVHFDGGFGADFLYGGDGPDTLVGGPEDDYFQTQDFAVDTVDGGSGLLDAAITDTLDKPTSLESNVVLPLGKLKLTPRSARVRAGKAARLSMSWTHPEGWRKLRSVELQVYADGRKVGAVEARPGGLQARGAVKVMAGSRVTHEDKTVSARLALRLPRSFAGERLRLAVEATDRLGHRQVEPDAGAIRVVN